MKTNSPAIIIPAPSQATNGAATNDAADIRGIKAPVEIPGGSFWLWCALAALAAAALSYFTWRYLRKHRAPSKTIEAIIPPHERARRKLQEALELIHQPRPFCILVSDALRSYLEEAFSMRAPERTTEEFLDELQSSALLSYSQKQLLGDFLMRCDLVKFAKHEPALEQLRELYQSALKLVDETQSLSLRNQVPPGAPTAPGVREPPAKGPPPQLAETAATAATGPLPRPKSPPPLPRATANDSP